MESNTNITSKAADGELVNEGVQTIKVISDPALYSVISTMKITCPDCLVEIIDEKRGGKDVKHKAWGINVKNGLAFLDDFVCDVCGKNAIQKYR
jgi:hypothetical protein